MSRDHDMTLRKHRKLSAGQHPALSTHPLLALHPISVLSSALISRCSRLDGGTRGHGQAAGLHWPVPRGAGHSSQALTPGAAGCRGVSPPREHLVPAWVRGGAVTCTAVCCHSTRCVRGASGSTRGPTALPTPRSRRQPRRPRLLLGRERISRQLRDCPGSLVSKTSQQTSSGAAQLPSPGGHAISGLCWGLPASPSGRLL